MLYGEEHMEFALVLLAVAVLALSGMVIYLFLFGGKGGKVRVESFGCDVESRHLGTQQPVDQRDRSTLQP
jgi:hypothetical protein